ncbi:DUF4832 domain-containing protein [Rubrolithibacter danxiaensis]|uniref:DUF4832 domain-containing protein n=1 Tax=Rubrolithibacter danxiaensis TaxID=3390805 RepID=UPI003BF7CA31
MKTIKFLLTVLIFSTSCKKAATQSSGTEELKTVTYEKSDEDFPNPERGFYRYSETRASNYTLLDLQELKKYRNANTVSGAEYKVVSTLVFRYFILDGFNDKLLPESFLENFKKDCETARQAGLKLIPRFTYTVDAKSGNCPEQFICPPYGDAPKAVVLSHIAQLKPVLQENTDVIACLQMGFIGTWGENYYTDYFGDASSNAQGKLLDKNWEDRFEVIKALLDAVPESRMIQVRYPQLKQRYVYGTTASVTVPPLIESEAYNYSDKARIGFHNDCFLASSDDFGTYEDYGNSSSPRKSENQTLRDYFSSDSKYVVVGGETCSDQYSPQNDCETAGHAEKEFAAMHYSFLNADYNNEVNNDWQSGGCMENIKKKLGYRLFLESAILPHEVKKDRSFQVNLNLANEGYAAPYNPRQVELVLRSKTGSEIYFLALDTDIRKWFSGKTEVKQSVTLPTEIKAGEYELLLNLSDPSPLLKSRSEFSIRLANKNTWEANTGFNKLNHTVLVE